jgi:hypothetical protein
MPSCATLEHPRSRRHPRGRSLEAETLVAHYACNQRYNRIEQKLLRKYELAPQDWDWLHRVEARRYELAPGVVAALDWLMALEQEEPI